MPDDTVPEQATIECPCSTRDMERGRIRWEAPNALCVRRVQMGSDRLTFGVSLSAFGGRAEE